VCLSCCCCFRHRAVHQWLTRLCRANLSVVQLPDKDIRKSKYSFLVSDLQRFASSFIIPISSHDFGRSSLTPLFELLHFCHVSSVPAAIVMMCDSSTLYVIQETSIEMAEFCLKLTPRQQSSFCPKLLHSNTPINGQFFCLFLATDQFCALNFANFLASGISSFHAMEEGAMVFNFLNWL
jgi:hypothetical protein